MNARYLKYLERKLLAVLKPARWASVIKDLRVRDAADTLIYVHIGKCGGASLFDAIRRSSIIQSKFKSVHKVHIKKPPVFKQAKYLIIVRNPISRTLSAFNWRYKLVVEDGVQEFRFQGEIGVLKKYRTLNALAEALYTLDGKVNTVAAKDFRRIHHLKEDISFYLSDVLRDVSEDQIFAVLVTEFLNEDILDTLEVGRVERIHDNKSGNSRDRSVLSALATRNLRRFLEDDYAAVEHLLNMKGISGERRRTLLA